MSKFKIGNVGDNESFNECSVETDNDDDEDDDDDDDDDDDITFRTRYHVHLPSSDESD